MNKNRITLKDIFIGTLFSLALLAIGFYISISKGDTSSSTFSAIDSLSNPYILVAIFVILVIIGAFCSALSNANVFGLHIHNFSPKKNQKEPPTSN